MRYLGNDRRIHRVYVTRNTEYHVRRDVCVAVRDRRSGHWVPAHLALQGRIRGGLNYFEQGGYTANDGDPSVGESLFLTTDGRDLVTSPVVAIERPVRQIVDAYPN